MFQGLLRRLNNRTGFTLVEVLMAVVIMSIGYLGLSAMTMAMTTTLSFSKRLTTATTLAQEKMEVIKQAPYANITTGNFPPEGYNTITGYPQYKRDVTVITDTPLSHTKTVLVIVSWPRGHDLAPHTVVLKTIINRP
jgi:prepilin-type N-terminal cleavage/methylation domain-containing protein